MALTRDADFPEEIAQLTATWSACAQGFAVDHVLEAAAQMMIMALGAVARRHTGSKDAALAFARQVTHGIVEGVDANWDRAAKPGDVPVRRG